MHDLTFFRNNLDAIAARLATRGFVLDVEEFRKLDTVSTSEFHTYSVGDLVLPKLGKTG